MPDPLPIRFNPFPGLRPFQMDEEHLFFGREQQRKELIALLREHRFLAVLGASGSGKSSLVRAGLLPALYGGVMAKAGSHWHIAILRPGASPVANLAVALLETELWPHGPIPSPLDLETTLNRSALGLLEAARQARLSDEHNLLIVVDQFEELFRFNQSQSERSTRDEASAFVSLLLEAARQSQLAIYVVLTMRSDFFGDCSQFEDLADAINKGEYLVPRLSREQKKQAIEGPARVGGASIAPRLVQRLLSDVGDDPDQLPVLQHALMRTWDRWEHETRTTGGPLDLEDYEGIGGMREALSRHADEVFEDLPDDRHRLVAARIFQTLTERGPDNRGIRRPTRLIRLAAIAGASEQECKIVIEAFRRSGRTFLMPPENTPLEANTVIDISHESLMRVWQRLRLWVEEEAQSARIYRRLAESAALHGDGKAGLYHDPDLQIALSWRDQSRPTAAWAERYHEGFDPAMSFLDRSAQVSRTEEEAREFARRRELEQARALAEAERRRAAEQTRFAVRLRWLVRGLGIVAMAALTAFLMALAARRQAQVNAALAESSRARAVRSAEEVRRTLTRADFATGVEMLATDQASKGLSFLARSLRTDPDFWPAAMRLLSALTDRNFSLDTLDPLKHEKPAEIFGLSPEGDIAITGVRGGTLRVWDARSEALRFELGQENPVQGAALTPNGERLIVFLASQALQVWDPRSGQPVGQLIKPGGGVINYWIHPKREVGPWVVTSSIDGSLQVWDALNGQSLSPPLKTDGRSLGTTLFSADGRMVVAAYDDNRIGAWELPAGEQVGKAIEFPSTTGWPNVQLSRDSSLVLIGAGDGKSCRWWDLRTGEAVVPSLDFEVPYYYRGFSADGSLVMLGSMDEGTFRTRTYQSRTGHEVGQRLEETEVTDVEFHPNRGIVAVITQRHRIKVRDALTGQIISELISPESPLSWMQLSPEGDRLVTADEEHTVRIWDLWDGRSLAKPMKHGSVVNRMVFSPDGERLVTGLEDGVLRVWDSRTGEAITENVHMEMFVSGIWFSRDGTTLLVSDSAFTMIGGRERFVSHGQAYLIGGQPGQSLLEPIPEQQSFQIWSNSRDGKRLFTGFRLPDREASRFTVWDLSSRRRVRDFDVNHWIQGLDPSDDGIRALALTTNRLAHVLDVETGRVLASLRHEEDPTGGAFNPQDNNQVITVSGHADLWKLIVWDAKTGKALFEPWTHAAPIQVIEFSRDGRMLASGSIDRTARVWDPKTGQPITPPLKHSGLVTTVAFNPAGDLLATSGLNSQIMVWNPSDGQLLQELPGDDTRTIDFSEDGRYLVTAGGGNDERSSLVKIWDVSTWRLVVEPLPSESLVYSARFDPSGRLLTTASSRGTLAVWDIATGRQVTESLTRLRVNSPAGNGAAGWVRLANGNPVFWQLPAVPAHVPSWLPILAEHVAGKRINDQGLTESVPRSGLKDLRRKLEGLPGDDELSLWARWFFGDRGSRTISPGSLTTVPDYVRVMSAGTNASQLRQALRYQPTNGLLFARLGRLAVSAHEEREQKRSSATNAIANSPIHLPARPWTTSAEWYTEQATNLAAMAAEPWWSRADVLTRLGKFDSAREAIDHAVNLAPTDPDAAYVEARLLLSQSQPDEAYRAYVRGLGHLLELESAEANDPDQRHTESFAEILDLNSRLPLDLAKYAGRPWEGGNTNVTPWRTQEADWLTRYASEIAADDMEVWNKRALVLQKARQPEPALAAVGRALALAANNPEPLYVKGRILEEQGNTNAAIEVYGQAIQSYVDHNGTNRANLKRYLLGRHALLDQSGRKKEAMRDYLRAHVPDRDPKAGIHQADLSAHYNAALNQSFHSPIKDGDGHLTALGTGLKTLAGVEFDVRGVIQLHGSISKSRSFLDYPTEVKGIQLPGKWKALHFLNGAGFYGAEADGTPVAIYRIHYADGQTTEFPVLYGKHVRDWWANSDDRPQPDNEESVVAWRGVGGAWLRIYKTRWKNPRPDAPITEIDLVSTMARTGLFLIAITAE